MVRLLVLLTLLAGCGGQPVARVGLYHRVDNYEWNNKASDTVFISNLGWKWGESPLECTWTHVSEPTRGTPFNGKRDLLATELLGCSYGLIR